MTVPLSDEEETTISAVSSPDSVRTFSIDIFAPMLFKHIYNSRARRVYSDIFGANTRIRHYCCGSHKECGGGNIARNAYILRIKLFFAGATRIVVLFTDISAPIAESIRSVWSRDFSVSCIIVAPSALQRGKDNCRLTCAEATFILYSIPWSLEPFKRDSICRLFLHPFPKAVRLRASSVCGILTHRRYGTVKVLTG